MHRISSVRYNHQSDVVVTRSKLMYSSLQYHDVISTDTQSASDTNNHHDLQSTYVNTGIVITLEGQSNFLKKKPLKYLLLIYSIWQSRKLERARCINFDAHK
jgi:hypothetical protein